MAENRTASEFSKRVADVLVGKHKAARLSQAQLSEQTGIKPRTLQRILSGTAEIEVEQLALISAASDTTPEAVLIEAVEKFGGLERLVSDAAATKDDLRERREKQEQARSMSTEALEDQERRAATDDEELGSDEPGTP